MRTRTSVFVLVPRDGMFFKDGRGWFTSASGRARSLSWPAPSTLRGALRTAWGRNYEEGHRLHLKSNAAAGEPSWPTVTEDVALNVALAVRRRINGGDWERVWHVPSDALFLEGKPDVERLEPRPVGLSFTWSPEGSDALELLWQPQVEEGAKPLSPPQWWTEEEFVAWLAGGVVRRSEGAGIALTTRTNVHVGIEAATGTAKEAILFSTETVETLSRSGKDVFEWAIALRAGFPDDPQVKVPDRDFYTLGGKRKLARAQALDAALLEPPDKLLAAFEQEKPRGIRLVAVSPCRFKKGWLPDGLKEGQGAFEGEVVKGEGQWIMRAALGGRPVNVSGWDMAEGRAKATERLAPAGSTWFFEKADGTSFTKVDAERLWLAKVGEQTDEGYGVVVPGVWDPGSKVL